MQQIISGRMESNGFNATLFMCKLTFWIGQWLFQTFFWNVPNFDLDSGKTNIFGYIVSLSFQKLEKSGNLTKCEEKTTKNQIQSKYL